MNKFNIKTQAIPTVASAYADVIGTTDNQIIEIKNELIIEDNQQLFRIHDDTIDQLAEHIAKDGQLSPCIVAPLPDGRYELIDGRHRRRAVIKAGLPTTKCIIKTNLSDKEKQTIRLTANLVRNNDYLPSELAFAYKKLAELEDLKTISEETNLSKKKIYRYIRLTHLIEPLLNRVDNGTIPVIAAVELSYLTEQQQKALFAFLLNHSDCKISTANARFIKENPEALIEAFYEEEQTKSLPDEALEPTEEEKPAKDNDIEKADNLSTDDTEDGSTDADAEQKETAGSEPKPELWYLDKRFNVHSCEDIEENDLRIICEAVIDATHIDYCIFRFAYSSNDVLAHWKENEIKSRRGHRVNDSSDRIVGFAEWASPTKRLFQIRIKNNFYTMPHKVLEQIVRKYIRENYTVKRIKEVIEERK